MKRSGHPKLDDLISELQGRGWRLVATGKHNKLVAPCGGTYTMAKSPSDRRAAENAFHVLRRVARQLGEDV